MLQSAIFADLQAAEVDSPAGSLLSQLGSFSQKGSLARMAAWGRSLLVRNELHGLNGHLLRDIGLHANV